MGDKERAACAEPHPRLAQKAQAVEAWPFVSQNSCLSSLSGSLILLESQRLTERRESR